MSPSLHGPRRAQVVLADAAAKQVQSLGPAELRALDRAIVAISVDPALGEQLSSGPLRQYREDDVRVVYFATALGTIVIVAYVEA